MCWLSSKGSSSRLKSVCALVSTRTQSSRWKGWSFKAGLALKRLLWVECRCLPMPYGPGPSACRQCLRPRRRKALPITETELRLMASAAISGESSHPVSGYSTPAAMGTPSAL